MGLRVLDTQTGQAVVLDESEAEAGVREGRYAVSATHGGPISLRDENGERFEVDPEALGGALEAGFRIETASEAEEYRLEQEHGDRPVQAFAEGAAVELAPSLGVFGAALSVDDLPEDVREGIQQRAQRNEGASVVGRVAGAALPAIVSGGTSLEATGARGLLGAAARGTPGGIAAALGGGVERALVQRGTSRFAATLAGAAADGALSGATSALTDAGLEGRPIEAEQILGNALFGAALGLGTGGVFHGAGALARRATRGAQEGVNRLAGYADDLARAGLGEGREVRRLAGGIEAAVNPRATEEGVEASLRRLSRRVSGVDPEDLALVAAQPARAFDGPGFDAAARRASESFDALGSRVDEVSAALADAERRSAAFARATADVDAVGAAHVSRSALEGVRSRLAEGVGAFSGRERSGRALRGLAAEVDGSLERLAGGNVSTSSALVELDRTVRALDSAASVAGDDGARAFVHELRTTLSTVASEPEAFGRGAALWSELDGASRTWAEVRDALALDQRQLARELTERGAATSATIEQAGRSLDAADGLLQASERAGSDVTEARAVLEEARRAMGEAVEHGEVRGAALRGLDAEGGGALTGLVARAAGGVAHKAGGVLGALLGGAPGYAIGGAAGSLVESAVNAATRPVNTYQRIARLGAAVQRYGPRVESGLGRLRSALESGTLERVATRTVRAGSRVVRALEGTQDERREEYRAAADQLRTLAADPEALASRLGESLGPSADIHSELSDHLAVTAARGVAYLASELPPASQQPSLWGEELEPSQFEMDDFLRRVEVIEDPASLIDHAAEGSIHLAHVEAVRTVYPEIYADLTARVSELLGELEEPPSYALRVQLGTFLDVPADPSLTPSMIDALQSRYSHTGAQYDAQNSPQQQAVARTGSLARVGSTLSGQSFSETQSLGRRP